MVDVGEYSPVLDEIVELLEDIDNWTVVVHQRPDGDTLGCGSAFVSLALELGKKVNWYGKDPFPDNYRFLANSERYLQVNDTSQADFAKDKLVIVLDTSNVERSIPLLGSGSILETPVINIDHHGDNTAYGDVNLIISSASSTGEILWNFFRDRNYPVTTEMAEALYVAIMTDTGNFAYGNTTSEVLKAAGELVSLGADPCKAYGYVYHNQSLSGLKLWGRAFDHAEFVHPGILLSWLSREDFLNTKATHEDTENLVSRILEVKKADFSILLVEENEGSVRCSFRSSSSNLSAREIASAWGGGGHPQASGCVIELPLSEALTAICEKVKDYV